MIFIRFYEFALFAFIAFFSYQASQLNQGLWLTGLCINCPCPFNSLTSDQYFSIVKSLHPYFYQLIQRHFLFETVYLFQSSFFTFWFRKQSSALSRTYNLHSQGKKYACFYRFSFREKNDDSRDLRKQLLVGVPNDIHRKTPGSDSLFNKVTSLRPKTLLRKRLQHRCFSVNFPKFLRTLF